MAKFTMVSPLWNLLLSLVGIKCVASSYNQAIASTPNGTIVVVTSSPASGFGESWRSDDSAASWDLVTSQSLWGPRRDLGLQSTVGGVLILTGGLRIEMSQPAVILSDVWMSDNYGRAWNEVTPIAQWPCRHGHAVLTLANDSLTMFGGLGERLLNDVWSSDDLGRNWKLLAIAPWDGRFRHAVQLAPGDSLLLMGGWSSSGPLSDVWQSRDGGASWRQLPHVPFAAGLGMLALSLSTGRMICISVPSGEVWTSTDGALHWIKSSQSLAIGSRKQRFAVRVGSTDSIVVIGSEMTVDETWRTHDGALTWERKPSGVTQGPDPSLLTVCQRESLQRGVQNECS